MPGFAFAGPAYVECKLSVCIQRQFSSVATLFLVLLCFGYDVISIGAAEYDTGQSSILSSEELGIKRCSLQGVISGEAVTMHVWLRVIPPDVAAPLRCKNVAAAMKEACQNTAVVRGFALIQSHLFSVPEIGYGGPQLLQATSSEKYAPRVYLRSPLTKKEYVLDIGRPHPRVQHDPKFPSFGISNEVMELRGAFPVHQSDRDRIDYELRVEGFQWYCPFIVHPPVLSRLPRPIGSVCLNHDATTTTVADGQLHAKPWTHVDKASLTENTEVWQLLAPFFHIHVRDYAKLLWYRVLWHWHMGVGKYLLYIYESVTPLLQEPMIQALMASGKLQVVLFTELPNFEKTKYKPTNRELYLMQIITYNHALLALWGSDSLVLSIDIDEYLLLPEKTTVVEAYKLCGLQKALLHAAPSQPWEPQPAGGLANLAGVEIRRTDAFCAPNATAEQCSPEHANLRSWLATDLAGVIRHEVKHPLSMHSMGDGSDVWQKNFMKPLLDPNAACRMHVHNFNPCPKKVAKTADPSCMRLLHLVDLYKIRSNTAAVQGPGGPNIDPEYQQFWWPLQHAVPDAFQQAVLKYFNITPPRRQFSRT